MSSKGVLISFFNLFATNWLLIVYHVDLLIYFFFLIRAKTIHGGAIVRPHPTLANSSKMTVLLQTDMKGWLPTNIVNTMSTEATGTWHKCLCDYHCGGSSTQGTKVQ